MNPKKKKHYIDLVEFLGRTLGPNCEVVLHVIEEDCVHIAAIENSHISGRNLDSPLTRFALTLMKKSGEIESNYVTNYKAMNKLGKEIQGSTFLIKDENGKLEGMLCINIDNSAYKRISEEILQLANVAAPVPSLFDFSSSEEDAEEDMVEVLSNNIQEIIYETIDPQMLDGKYTLSTEGKIEIVEKLERKGIFQLKGAVCQVAEILNVSEPTIYRYLKVVTSK